MSIAESRKPWYRILYVQVLIAVALGILLGAIAPDLGKELKPLGDGFVKLVKMLIAPIVFCTVVHGIGSMTDLKHLGRLGLKTIIYFEVVSTLALIIGLIVVNILRPGDGFTPAGETFHATGTAAAGFIEKSHALGTVDFLLKIIPETFFSAFASGDLLSILFIAVLSAFALQAMGTRGEPVLHAIDLATELFFNLIKIVVKVAPIGAFGAMAFTVGSFGFEALAKLGYLMLGFYLTAGFFVVVVLGLISRAAGFSVFRFIAYIKDELLLVLGTSSSETALPGIISKLRHSGCRASTVGLVVPTGYSMNLDGTNIYMAMAAIFLAQATNTPLSLSQQIGLLLVTMLTSKGASGVTGAGFITLAATIQAVPVIPIESLAILVGIDRFMSECRALTNLIGNGVATLVISKSEGELPEGPSFATPHLN